jgi:hypothetical protein
MELLETDDPEKGQLLKKSAHHREQLEEDARFISERTEKILTNAVIIGGALVVTYFLVSRFSGGSKQKKKSKTARIKLVQAGNEEEVVQTTVAEPESLGIVSQIGTALASQATVFLLGLAKEKLGEFLQSQSAKKPNSNEPS